MRSLQLIFVLIATLVVHPIKASNSSLIPADYFNITLPYDLKQNQSTDLKVRQTASRAMELLLLRVTGQNRLLESSLGQRYVTQAKSWLANYNIKPRYADGVVVGKNIQLQFDAARLKKSLTDQHVKLWAAGQRPKTMVMGIFVQQGQLQKLTDEKLSYRIDVDCRRYPAHLKLPFSVAETEKNWVFPVEPSNNRSLIQEVLLASDNQNLLSFKMVSRANQQYELSWYLFNLSGSAIGQASVKGKNRQKLLRQMFVEAMQIYARQNSVVTVTKNQLLLNLNQVTSGDLVTYLENEIGQQQPLVQSANLVKLSSGTAQIQIEYQGEQESLLSWLSSWPRGEFRGESGENTFDIDITPELNTMEFVAIEQGLAKRLAEDEKLLKQERGVVPAQPLQVNPPVMVR